MAPTSNGTTDSYGERDTFLLYSILQCVSGSLLLTTNGLIVLPILSYRLLRNRKEYFIIMSLALADMLNGLGYLMAGTWRMYLVLSNQYSNLKTAWQCLLMPYNLLWVWVEPATYTMLVCVSVDRVLAVATPIRYFKSDVTYAYKIVGVFWGWSIVGGAVGMGFSYLESEEAIYKAICYTSWAVGKRFALYTRNIAVPCGTLSVVLYCLVPIIYKHSKATVSATVKNQNQIQELAMQRRVTKTMGIGACCTFVFFLLPKALYMLVLLYFGGNIPMNLYLVVSTPAYLIPHINSLCNLALYVWRHAKFRKAFVHFVKCKPLPANFHAING